MNLDWLLSPATQYGALALGLAACMFLFISSKMELKSFRRQTTESTAMVAANFTNLSAEMQGIRDDVRELETAPAVAMPVDGLNLTKRAQALRMYHRGEAIPTIAAALRAPQNEVELLLKVQQLVQHQ